MDQCFKKLIFHIPKRFLSQTIQKMAVSQDKGFRIAGQSYEDAISTLNTLQSNAQVRANIVLNRGTEDKSKILSEMKRNLEKGGVTHDILNTLNIIHVAGTKGKGMTCAFTESILRQAGLRTGFFSSPHLISVRERIKINGISITPEQFAQYFFHVYNAISSQKDDVPMPAYFRFLTCMAFHIFLEEKVDVAIMEVGIGGRYDCTNVVSMPTVVGITSLSLEHQSILGQTIEEIAWNKAGIMKEKVPAFTVPNHPHNVIEILKNCAMNVNCPLYIAQPLSNYPVNFDLSVDDGNVSRLNAALAIQLSNSFLSQKYPEKLNSIENTSKENTSKENTLGRILPFHVKGLKTTVWPGRFQVIKISENLQYFLDGAHTQDSLSVAMKWFERSSNLNAYRVLIFNVTGERSAKQFLELFSNSKLFDLVVFSSILRRNTTMYQDNWSALSEGDLSLCQKHLELWKTLSSTAALVAKDIDEATELMVQIREVQNGQGDFETPDLNNGHVHISSKRRSVDVLITGSLHLVGNFLSILDP